MKNIKDIFRKFFIILIIMLLQFIPLNAQASENTEESDEKVPVMSEEEEKNKLFLIQVRQQLQNSRNEYFQVKKNITEVKDRLLQVTEAITTLKEQIENLDYLIANTEAKIHNVEKQIAQKENQIDVLMEEIQIKKIELKNQKILLKEYLKLLYIQENEFYDDTEEMDISVIKLLLDDNSVGETFQEIQYFTILEQTGENIFNKIETLKTSLEVQNIKLTETQDKLAKLNTQLAEEKKNLLLQRNAKDKLLKQTKGEEEIYRELIAASKAEQLALIEEINALKKNLVFIEEKIIEEGDDFDPDNYKNLITPNVRAIYDFEMSGEFIAGEKLNWPVKPSRGISAYFRDPAYYGTFGIPHNAIDLPTPQGTPIRAPAAGVVYKVKDNDDANYSYIILAHKGGLLTVYGHMYAVMVDERDIVFPGEVIGLSGGIPGTKGAGYLTTGAHLHFEVIKSGKHINPLLVLPLDKLPEEYIPKIKEDEDEESDEEEDE